MALTITRHEQEGISIIRLQGKLVFGEEDITFNDEVRQALAARRDRVVMDLSGVTKMDSAGLGTLLYARAELRRAGGGLALANLNSNHIHAFLVAKLETIFDVYGSQQDAINSFFPERAVPHYDLLELVSAVRQVRSVQPPLTRAS